MSVDIHWDTLTNGPDGERIAEIVRAFIHERFQQVTLPRFIRSVQVHAFDFGDVPPDIEIKDICDPLPDFYDDQEDEEDPEIGEADIKVPSQSAAGFTNESLPVKHPLSANLHGLPASELQQRSSFTDTRHTGIKRAINHQDQPTSPFFTNLPTPGIPGGTSNLNYFHLPFGPGLSGSATPLAAVAGAHFPSGWPESANTVRPSPSPEQGHDVLRTPSSTADPSSRPQSQHQSIGVLEGHSHYDVDQLPASNVSDHQLPDLHESNPNDIQVVAHVQYSGNLRLSLTAEILLDYPMPSFVGIPLQLRITGLRFDGIAILAYIKKRAHVCFLSPEDAEAFVDQGRDTTAHEQSSIFGGLLEEIKVESEIGEKETGKQVLKNVGKVEKFILEQVRRIFEDEFVYPSFWTFLV